MKNKKRFAAAFLAAAMLFGTAAELPAGVFGSSVISASAAENENAYSRSSIPTIYSRNVNDIASPIKGDMIIDNDASGLTKFHNSNGCFESNIVSKGSLYFGQGITTQTFRDTVRNHAPTITAVGNIFMTNLDMKTSVGKTDANGRRKTDADYDRNNLLNKDGYINSDSNIVVGYGCSIGGYDGTEKDPIDMYCRNLYIGSIATPTGVSTDVQSEVEEVRAAVISAGVSVYQNGVGQFITGNVYVKKGSGSSQKGNVYINQNGRGAIVDGDMFVDGDLYINSGKLTVKGALYVGGKIYGPDGSEITGTSENLDYIIKLTTNASDKRSEKPDMDYAAGMYSYGVSENPSINDADFIKSNTANDLYRNGMINNTDNTELAGAAKRLQDEYQFALEHGTDTPYTDLSGSISYPSDIVTVGSTQRNKKYGAGVNITKSCKLSPKEASPNGAASNTPAKFTVHVTNEDIVILLPMTGTSTQMGAKIRVDNSAKTGDYFVYFMFYDPNNSNEAFLNYYTKLPAENSSKTIVFSPGPNAKDGAQVSDTEFCEMNSSTVTNQESTNIFYLLPDGMNMNIGADGIHSILQGVVYGPKSKINFTQPASSGNYSGVYGKILSNEFYVASNHNIQIVFDCEPNENSILDYCSSVKSTCKEHDFVSYRVQPTATEYGEIKKICQNCGESYTVTIPPLGPPKYSVKYVNGSSVTIINDIPDGSDITQFAPPNVSYPNSADASKYFFVGWYDQPNGNGEIIESVTSNMTAYAFWLKGVEVNFEDFDGNVYYTTYIKQGTSIDTISTLPEPSDANRVFFKFVNKADGQEIGTRLTGGSVTYKPLSTQKGMNEHSHIYERISTKESTCIEVGYNEYVCVECGECYTDEIPTIPHSYQATTTKPATCTDEGAITYTCSVCGDSYTETIPASGHNYIAHVVAPTYTETGYTEYTCSVCGNSYIADETPVLDKIDISYGSVSLSYDSYTYTGSTIKPAVTVYVNGVRLTSSDYILAYSDNVRVGSATITVKGVGHYTGTIYKNFIISPKAGSLMLECNNGAFRATWSEDSGADGYQIVYSKDRYFNSGVYTYTVTNRYKTTENFSSKPRMGETWYVKYRPYFSAYGIKYGEYSSVKSITIQQISLSSAKVMIPYASYTYTGSAIKPPVTVKVNGKKLSTSDYTVKYTNNTKVGTATITITGKGNWSGSFKRTFTVKQRAISSATVAGISDKAYTGSAIKPTPSVKYNGKTLTKGTDYTISYKSNKAIGTAQCVITGKGNFKGTKTVKFKITANLKAPTLKDLAANDTSKEPFDLTGACIAKWGSVSGAKGYELVYSINKDFAKPKHSVKVTGTKRLVTGLYGMETYYFKVRAYTVINGKTYYGPYSNVKTWIAITNMVDMGSNMSERDKLEMANGIIETSFTSENIKSGLRHTKVEFRKNEVRHYITFDYLEASAYLLPKSKFDSLIASFCKISLAGKKYLNALGYRNTHYTVYLYGMRAHHDGEYSPELLVIITDGYGKVVI